MALSVIVCFELPPSSAPNHRLARDFLVIHGLSGTSATFHMELPNSLFQGDWRGPESTLEEVYAAVKKKLFGPEIGVTHLVVSEVGPAMSAGPEGGERWRAEKEVRERARG